LTYLRSFGGGGSGVFRAAARPDPKINRTQDNGFAQRTFREKRPGSQA
jgi:hypothetical protein